MIALVGQAVYTTKRAARTGAEIEIRELILNDILFPEIRPIATVIFQTADGYANAMEARIVTTADGDDYIDWRSETISRVAISTTDHNSLTGIQGGTTDEYYHLDFTDYTELTEWLDNVTLGSDGKITATEFIGPINGIVGGTTPADGSFTDVVANTIDGNTLIVSTNSAYDTITKAMAAATAGDTILVSEGTYAEAVTFSQDNLTLKAIGSAENTIIDYDDAVVVNFSTKPGCTLDGFTVNQDSVNADTDYLIYSSNVSATDYNTIQNCILDSSADAAYKLYAIYVNDGNTIVRNNRITVSNVSTSANHTFGVRYGSELGHTTITENNVITINQDATGAYAAIGIALDAGAITYANNNKIVITTDATTTGVGCGIYGSASVNYINSNRISVIASGTGAVRAVGVGATDTAYVNNNVIYSTTGDSDGEWLNNIGTAVYAVGNNITGDGAITAGTLYSAGNLINDALQAPDGSAASTGVGSIKMANGNTADSAGFLKMAKEDGTVVYIPYFADETP